MKIAVVTLMVLGVLAASAAVFVVRILRLNPESMIPEAQTVNVVVAQTDLPAMAVIAEEDIMVESIPRPSAPAGCLLSPVEAIGRSLNAGIMKGQVLTRSCLAAPGSPADSIARIPAGMRVATIPVSAHSISGGFLYPGCTVDVMVTYQRSGASSDEPIAYLLLQRRTVWGVDDQTIASLQAQNGSDKPESRPPGSSGVYRVGLLVDTKQAETLQAAASRGTITLAIRNPLDMAIRETPVIDPNEMVVPKTIVEGPAAKEHEPPEPLPSKRVQVIKGGKIEDQTFPLGPGGESNGSKSVQPVELKMLSE